MSITLRPSFWSVALVATFGLHCGSEDSETDTGTTTPDSGIVADSGVTTDSGIVGDSGVRPDTGVTPDSGVVPDTGVLPDGGPVDGGDDGNNSFATARTLTIDAQLGMTFEINPATDKDFYRLDAPADTWLLLTTTGTNLDTVIRLYNSAETLLATNDDVFPRAGTTNSELIYYFATAGTYYLEVLEYADWAGETPNGGPTFRYRVQAATIRPDQAANVIEDAEGGNDPGSAQTAEVPNNAGFILGHFTDGNDVDFYRVPVVGADRSLAVTLMPAGPMGYGTTAAGRVELAPVLGSSTAIARIDQAAGYSFLQPPTAAGDYHLSVRHNGGAASAGEFYVIKVANNGENPPETNEPGNDLLSGAAPLTLADDGAGGRQAFVLSTLVDGDLDYYQLTTLAGEALTVACVSAVSGSGVMGLTAEIRDSTDAVLTMATEMAPTSNIFIDEFALPAAGNYYVRLSKAGQLADVSGEWVRCGFFTAVP